MPATRKCEDCKKETVLEDLRLFQKDASRLWTVCNECCDRLKNRAKPDSYVAAKEKQDEKRLKKELTIKESLPRPEKEPFVCVRCNYRFKANTGQAGVTYNLRCPYCGKADQLVQRAGIYA